MPLFVLMDSLTEPFKKRYTPALERIRGRLLQKIHRFGTAILVRAGDYPNAATLYRFLAEEAAGQDLLMLDAYAGALCTEDLVLFLEYQAAHSYDVLFAERLPEGLLPDLVSADFLPELLLMIPEEAEACLPLKKLISWEYKGVDVGIWLSPSKLVLERVSFLPRDKNSTAFLDTVSAELSFSVSAAERAVQEKMRLIHCAPFYCAIEWEKDGVFIDTGLFQKIIAGLDRFAPEAVLSAGVHNEVFRHPYFYELLEMIGPERSVLVESPAQALFEEKIRAALSRPHTDVVLNDSPKTRALAREFAGHSNFWVRLIRNRESEERIPDFLKEYAFLGNRAIVSKEDSFGHAENAPVDLSPLHRHACTALGRELIVMPEGGVSVCRQAPSVIRASFSERSIEEIWALSLDDYEKQCHNPNYAVCGLCSGCGDWWVFNY